MRASVSYFENEEPVDELTFKRTKTKEIKVEDIKNTEEIEKSNEKGDK